MGKRLTKEMFVEKSTAIHGNFYNYEQVVYRNRTTKVKIICPIHGEFEQQPAHHMNGHDCFKCSYEKRNKYKLKGKNFYTNKLKEKYGDEYIFEFEYPFKDSIKVHCKIHGLIEKNIGNLMNGNGSPCPFCSGKRTKENDFINEMNIKYGGKYDYSKIDFSDRNNLIIICPTHGEFTQSFIEHKHIRGDACPKCHVPNKYDTKFFKKICIEKYGDLYDYSLVEYINSTEIVKIICKKHGIFYRTPNKFLSGQCCNKCAKTSYTGEIKVEKTLQKLNKSYMKQFWFSDCKYKRYLKFDFAVFKDEKLFCLIEYDGEQHYGIFEFKKGSFESVKRNDKIKTDYCLQNNIKLIRIPYWEKDNIENILTKELTFS